MAAKYPALLPPNAVPLEKALAESTGRLDNEIDVPIDLLLQPAKCPAGYLPWLAWYFSLDLWDWEWSESKRREVIAKAIDLASHKGTEYGMSLGLEIMGYEAIQYLVPPGGFYASPNLTQAEWDAWIHKMPQIRIKFAEYEGYAGYDEHFAEPEERIPLPPSPYPDEWDPGYTLGTDGCAGATVAGKDDGWALYGRQAVYRAADGTETNLRLTEWVDTTVTKPAVLIGRVSTPGLAAAETGFWSNPTEEGLIEGTLGEGGVGFVGEDAYVCFELTVPELITYRIDTSYDHTTSDLHLDYITPGLEPIDIRYERNSDIGDAYAYIYASDAFATPGSNPPTTRLLDNFTGASVAYSLRKLHEAYTGYAIRIRRESDDAELDVGFEEYGNLDTDAIDAFLGTNEKGYISVWYDQSGNSPAHDLVQNDDTKQPLYVPTGPYGKPTVEFVDQHMSVAIDRDALYSGDDVSIMAVFTPDSMSGQVERTLFGWKDDTSPSNYVLDFLPAYLDQFAVFDNGDDAYPSTTRVTPELPADWLDNPHVVQLWRDTQNNQAVVADGVLVEEVFDGLTDTIPDSPSMSGTLTVGDLSPTADQAVYAQLSELVFWPNYQKQALRVGVYAQVSAYYEAWQPLPEGDLDNAFSDNDSWAARAMADRIYLYDTDVVTPLLQGISFANVDRVNVPVFHADVLVDLKTKDMLPAWYVEESYSDDAFASPEDLTHFDRACRTLESTKALRDEVCVSFEVTRPLRFRDFAHTDETTSFGDQARTIL